MRLRLRTSPGGQGRRWPEISSGRIAAAALLAAVAYNAVVTQDVKLAGLPLKVYLLFLCLAAWAFDARPWRRAVPWPRLGVWVLLAAVVVPMIWFGVAFVRYRSGDPAQSGGLNSAATEASHFIYLLLFFPLVDHLRTARHEDRVWIWPVAVTCGISLAIWLAWQLSGDDYASHQLSLISGVVGNGPGGYRVALPTQVMVIPALALLLARVAAGRLTRASGALIALLLAALVVSHTRGYWLGALVVVGVLIVLTVRGIGARYVRPAALGAILLALVASQVAAAFGPGGASVHELSLSQRLQEAHQLLHGIRAHVLIGSGVGAHLPNGYVRSVSNPWSFELTYYQLLFELGPLGLLAVLALPLVAIRRCWQALPRLSPERAIEARVAIAGLLALLVADSSNPYLINSVGMLALAIVAVYGELALDEPDAATRKFSPPHDTTVSQAVEVTGGVT